MQVRQVEIEMIMIIMAVSVAQLSHPVDRSALQEWQLSRPHKSSLNSVNGLFYEFMHT